MVGVEVRGCEWDVEDCVGVMVGAANDGGRYVCRCLVLWVWISTVGGGGSPEERWGRDDDDDEGGGGAAAPGSAVGVRNGAQSGSAAMSRPAMSSASW